MILCAPLALYSYSTVNLTLNLDENVPWVHAFGVAAGPLLPNSDLSFQILTSLTHLFTETFSPPDAVASIFFVSSGDSSVPVLDGLNSYQPASANNASILSYTWDLTALPVASASATDNVTSWSGTSTTTRSGSCALASSTALSSPTFAYLGHAVGNVSGLTITGQSCEGDNETVDFAFTFTATAGGSVAGTFGFNFTDDWAGEPGPITGAAATLTQPPTLTGSATISAPAGVGFNPGSLTVTSLSGNDSFSDVEGTATYSGGLGGTSAVSYAAEYSGAVAAPVPSAVEIGWAYTASCGGSSGPELECQGLASGVEYSIVLTVTNTDGLMGDSTITYVPPRSWSEAPNARPGVLAPGKDRGASARGECLRWGNPS